MEPDSKSGKEDGNWDEDGDPARERSGLTRQVIPQWVNGVTNHKGNPQCD
jgi:hypothetical protein